MPPAPTQLTDARPARTVAPLVPAWWVAAPALLALALLLLDLATDFDLALTRLFYDAGAHGFPLRSDFWVEIVMHHWVKYAVVTMGCLVAGALVLSHVLPPLKAERPVLLFLVLAMALAPLSVALAKAASSRPCPWDVDEFGGLVSYARVFAPLRPNAPPGHCFPDGHASTGYALLAFYFVAFAQRRRKAARYALAIGIAAGLVLGFGRVLQGAHFASHALWSGLLCWTVMLPLYQALLAGRTVLQRQTATLAVSRS